MITAKVYIDFDRDGTWTDVTAYVETAGTLSGMTVVDARIADIGTCVLRAINTDRRWSPDNAGGPYYPYLLPNRPVKIEATDGVTTWPIWRGFTQRITPDPDQYGTLYATIECVDVLGLLQTYGVTIPVQEDILPGDLLRAVTSTALRAPRATGYIEFLDNPSNGETVTIGTMTYRFVTVLAQANDVLIGDDAEATATNLVAAIHRDTGSGTLYHASTERHPRVTAALDGEELSIPTAGYAQGFAVGRFDNGNMYHEGQSITLETGGLFSEFALWLSTRGGSPTGTVTWSLFAFDPDTGETVGAALESGTFTPTTPEPAWNTIAAAGTTYLEPGVYKLEVKPTTDQGIGHYWVILASDGTTGDVYTEGTFWQLQVDEVGVPIPDPEWTEWPNQDLTMTLTCAFRRVYLTAVVRGAWGNDIALGSSEGLQRVSTGITVNAGTVASGTLADTYTTDGVEYVIAESNGTPGFQLLLAFGGLVDDGQELRIRGFYDGSAGHTVNVEAWNGGGFDILGTLPDATTETLYTFTLDPSHTIGGEVLIRINHSSPGNINHQLHLDHIFVLDSDASPSDHIDLSGTALAGGVDEPDGLLDTEDGQRVLSLAGEDWDENTNALTALGEIARAEFGLLWIARDGTITFRDQQYVFLQANNTPDMVLEDDHNIQFAALSIDDVKNRVVITYTPYAELESGVVARAQEPIRVLTKRKKSYQRWNPSDDVTVERGLSVVRLKYVDVETGQIAAAKDIQQPLTPGSDYRVFFSEEAPGADRSSEGWVKFALALTGSGVEVYLTNTLNRHLWVHDLQVRGTALVKYDPITVVVEDVDSQAEYGTHELALDIPLLSDRIRDYATLLGQYLMNNSKDPFLRVGLLGFNGVEQVGGVDVYGLEIGDIIQASEAQTGISGQTFLVIGMQYSFASGQLPQAVFYVVRLDDIPYGIYDDADYGVYNEAYYAL